MTRNAFTITPERFISAVDYVVHNHSIELAHFFLREDKPIGSLTEKPCYTLFGEEKGASLSTMFNLAKTGKSSIDEDIYRVLYISSGWKRQVIPESALDILREVVQTDVLLREIDIKISDWRMLYHVSPKNEKGYKSNASLQLAQKQEDSMDLLRTNTLAKLRELELRVVTEHGFDLAKYPTISYGSLGDSTPYKMDHVMDEAKIHAIEYYFNPTPINTMVFNMLKPLHDKQMKDYVDVFKTYKAIMDRQPITL